MIYNVARGCPDRLSRSRGLPVVSWNAFRIRLHAPPPFRPMSGAAYGKAESPRLSPNRLKRAVVSANQLLLFRPDLPRRREKPRRPRQQGHVVVVEAVSAWRVAQKWVAVGSGWSPACPAAAAPLAFGPTVAKMVLRSAYRDEEASRCLRM